MFLRLKKITVHIYSEDDGLKIQARESTSPNIFVVLSLV